MPRSRLVRLILIYLLALLLIWGLGTWVGERSVPTLLMAYLPPLVFAWPAPLLLLAALISRRWAAINLALLTGLAALLFLGWQPVRTAGTGRLRVVTYNVARGGFASPAQIAGTLLSADADVLALQEVNGLQPGLLDGLAAWLPGYRLARARELAIFSRLPVLGVQDHAIPQDTRSYLEVRLRWQGRPLRVINAHPATVTVTGDIPATRARRARQFAFLGTLTRADPQRPTLLLGDFNTPPRGLIHRELARDFTNAWAVAGRGGFGYTFTYPPGRPVPLLRIDHVWARGLTPVGARVLGATTSDHLPLVVDLK